MKFQIEVDTLRAILGVKTNIKLSCETFCKKLAENYNFLKKRLYSFEKYCK